MKAEILRRAEEISDEEEELTAAFDDAVDLEAESKVKVVGDGEDSGDDDTDGEDAIPPRPSPETILELAYIRDPKLLDRDANTRRSKSRAELKVQTGMPCNPSLCS